MFPMEVIGHLARPLSLSLRLFGNMTGDHMVLAVFVLMATKLMQTILAANPALWIFSLFGPVIPIMVMLLGIFVAVVQTMVFLLLTLSYLAGAMSEAH
jgi:F-type H+-transporting ATPase subunit a